MALLDFHHPWLLVFGILGNIISITVFLVPTSTFIRIYKEKSTMGFHSLPYVIALLSSLLWMYYAFLVKNANLLFTINSVGIVTETIYITIFLIYASKKARVQVIRTKSVEFLPFYLSFFLALNAIMWGGYGTILKDLRIALPNVLGFLLALVQILLYVIYRKAKPVVEENKKVSEHVVVDMKLQETSNQGK
ncbi:bidirectional sugar transporter N3-like [Ipomoea triloba]|uniref:bidirectional sugar transporter N3-like n=1 Tax=Ipomoea triloba TaxID=35885 RepID=UPI00125E953D|nr:bidirectional sugar transporter N3-like [Ipomoea triloba]